MEPLQKTCPGCRRISPADARFCSHCGAALDAEVARTRDASQDAERRQLTVMFCDLVDSTQLAARLDPEDLRTVLAAYQESCAAAIRRFGGSIAQYLGDGLLVYFGYPTAHEDAPQRAVRAGLGIVEAIQTLNERLRREMSIELGVRVGIHTGLVVVGEMGGGEHRERLALGETPNVAARVHAIAEPGSVLVTQATRSLVEGWFGFGARRAVRLKGIAERVEVTPVLNESRTATRLSTHGRLTPLVGREDVTGRLVEAWEEVKRGRGHAFLVTGDAGIGKSRIVETLKEHVAAESQRYLECRASPFFQHSALHPLIDLIERVLDLKESDSAEEKLGKLEELLRRFPLPLDETAPLLATLLSIDVPDDRYPPLSLTPQAQRHRTLETVLRMLAERARRGPLLLVMEDLHWVDASTLEFLDRMLGDRDVPALLLLTARPSFEPRWPDPSAVETLRLDPLDAAQVEEMVEQITAGKTLPPEIRAQLVERSDGVPLFVEEMTKAVLGSGHLTETETGYELPSGATEVGIPATLQDPLMARLDQQQSAKAVAQHAAVIGRTFSYELMRELETLDESVLQRELERLVQADLLRRVGEGAEAVFTFKHALIQQAAYESLLRRTRQRFHLEIARALESRPGDAVESKPEILAHHYAEGGDALKAAGYWHRAGERALQRSANVEAISHFRRGLDALADLPEDAERQHLELRLQLGLSVPLQATIGYTAPEVERLIARVQELLERIGDFPERYAALRVLRTFHTLRCNPLAAVEVGEQLIDVAVREGKPELMLESQANYGAAWFWLGEFARAESHFEPVIARYDPKDHKRFIVASPADPGVLALEYSSWSLWFLGDDEGALARGHEAIELGRSLGHPFSETSALVYAACLHYFRRDPGPAEEAAQQGVALGLQQGLLWWVALGTILRGWALAARGEAEPAIPQIRMCLDRMWQMGTELSRPDFLNMLAQAHLRIGQTSEATACYDEATRLLAKREDRSYEAAIVHHAKGEMLQGLPEPDTAGAVRCFEHALAIARRQGSHNMRLRIALSLARLRAASDAEGARALLDEATAPFEGLAGNHELVRAHALRRELGGHAQPPE